jgi:hypothetical protein
MKAILWSALLLLPCTGRAADAASRDDDLAALIEDCLGTREIGELTAAVRHEVGKFVSPAPMMPEPREASIRGLYRPNQDWLLRELGHFIRVNAGTLGEGLPPVSRFSKPQRLGPLFYGMLPDRFEKDPAAMLQPLLPLVTPEWLATAADCGAFDFVHAVRLLHGEINDLLRAYQQAENETGLLRLGRVLGRYPGIAEQVKPAEFATSTLALLLSGAFADENFRDQAAATLAITCGKWSVPHPELCDELERITPADRSAALCPIARCLLRGERDEAARRIDQLHEFYYESARQLQYALLSQPDSTEPEIAAAARAMTSANLVGVLRKMLDINKHDDRELERAMPLLRELLTRRDLPGGPGSSVHAPHLRATALRWWMAGDEERAGELMRLCFLTERANEPGYELTRLAKLLTLLGKGAGLAADVDRLAGAWGEKRFFYHRQAMRQASGQQPVSAAVRCGIPELIAAGKIIEALVGEADAALACYRALPAESQVTYAPWLVLTGNAAASVSREAPAKVGASEAANQELTISIETRPGAHFDPKAAEFRVFDAMGEVRRLLASGEASHAQELFQQTLIRCLLDDLKCEQASLRIAGIADSRYGRKTAGMHVAPWDMITVAISSWNLDELLLRDHVMLEARRGAGAGFDHAGLTFARYLARHGAYQEARDVAIVYQVPVGSTKPHRRPLLAEMDGLAQAAAGRTNTALLRLSACMELNPNDTAPGKAIIACLEKHAGHEAAIAAKAAVREYWRLKLEQDSNNQGIRAAAQRWLAILESP